MIIQKDIIDKMDADERKLYIHHLQSYIIVKGQINATRESCEDALLCYMQHREELSGYLVRENDTENRLKRFAEEMEKKYPTPWRNFVYEFKAESEDKNDSQS